MKISFVKPAIKSSAHRLLFFIIIAVMLCALSTRSLSAEDSVVTVTVGAARALPPDFLGINFENVNPAASPELLRAFERTGTAHIRYPGGGVANYWDWALGWIGQHLDENRLLSWMYGMQASPERFTLEDLAQARAASGASVIFVLNIVTDTLENQIAHLQRAETLGIPITRVELGNELYMDIEPYVLERYPTVQAYAQEANRWAAALKTVFPAVQVAAVGAGRGYAPPNSRTGTWNRELFSLLTHDIDAIAEHLYIDSGVGGRVPPNGTGWGTPAEQRAQHDALRTADGVMQFMARPFKAWRDFQMFSQLTPDRDIWMTEFNLFDWVGPARGTWAHGLMVGGFVHNFLTHERVTLATYHSLAGGPLFPAVFPHADLWAGLTTANIRTPTYELTASGVTLSLLSGALNGMTSAAPLIFTPDILFNPPLAAPYPALWGWRFSADESASFALANISADAITVDLRALAIDAQPYEQVYAAPEAYVLGAQTLTRVVGSVPERLTLPAYSLSIMGGAVAAPPNQP